MPSRRRILSPGSESVYNEKRISVQAEDGSKVEYRVWNPFRSKLAAAILGGVDEIWIARILAQNSSFFLKAGGHFVSSIKANCIDSTVPAETVFAQEVKKLQAEQFKPSEQVTQSLSNEILPV